MVVTLPLLLLFFVLALISLVYSDTSKWDALVFVGFGFFLGLSLLGATVGTELHGFLLHLDSGK